MRRRESDLGGWVLRGGIAAFFIITGAEKFSNGPHSAWVAIFQQIGFGEWFRYFTGAVEIAGGLLFVFPVTMWIGAGMLTCTMLGAMLVHLFVRHSVGSSIYPAIWLAAVV